MDRDSTMPMKPAWSPGSSFGSYVLERPLARGGFATVYRARHPEFGVVALKLLSDPEDEVERRFVREAGLNLEHPCIPRIYEHGTVDGVPFMAQELIEGRTLTDVIDGGPMPVDDALHLTGSLAEALHYAHGKGVVHRDLKPQNIMVRDDGTPVILDFGIARVMNLDTLSQGDRGLLGSPLYMAPEQIMGEPTGPPADLYSIGVILHQLLTGMLPIDGNDLTTVLFAAVHRVPPPPSARKPGLPVAVDRIVARLLQKRPEDRYPSAEVLAAVLADPDAEACGTAPERGRTLALWGREAELDRLREAADAALAGHAVVVAVAGETGVGKTRLIGELAALVRPRGMRATTGRALPMGAVPYQALVSALRQMLEARQVTTPDELAGLARRAGSELETMLPVARALLFASETLEPFGREQVWEVLRRFLGALAREVPALIVLEDMHHADEATFMALSFLARNLTAPVLFVATYRPEEVGEGHPMTRFRDEAAAAGSVTELGLQRLPAHALRALIEDFLGGRQVSDELCQRVFAESDGNPFYALEVLRLLHEEGTLSQRDGRVEITARSGPALPKRVTEIIEKRLGRLTEAQRDLLDVAAVEGLELTSEVLGHVSGLGRIAVLKTLRSLETQHRLIQPLERAYRFDHAKVRDVVYSLLPPELRREYHSLIASFLCERHGGDDDRASAIAHHLEEAGRRDEAAPFVLRAARRAKALYANALALGLYERFLRLRSREDADVAKVLAERGAVLLLAGHAEEALCEIDSAIGVAERLKDASCQALAISGRADVLLFQGRYDQAVAQFEKAEAIFRELGDRSGESRALSGRGMAEKDRGDLGRAQELTERSLVLRRSMGDLQGEASSLNRLGVVHLTRRAWDEAMAALTEARAIYQRLGERLGEASAVLNIANIPHQEASARKEQYREALALFRSVGDARGQGIATMNLSMLEPPVEQIALLREALAIFRGIGSRHDETRTQLHLARMLMDHGRPSEARQAAAGALEASRAVDARLYAGWALYYLGLAGRAEGAVEAKAQLEESARLLAAAGSRAEEADAWLELGDFQHADGATEAARRAYGRALEAAHAASDAARAARAKAGLERPS